MNRITFIKALIITPVVSLLSSCLIKKRLTNKVYNKTSNTIDNNNTTTTTSNCQSYLLVISSNKYKNPLVTIDYDGTVRINHLGADKEAAEIFYKTLGEYVKKYNKRSTIEI